MFGKNRGLFSRVVLINDLFDLERAELLSWNGLYFKWSGCYKKYRTREKKNTFDITGFG